mgnify:FL=1
MLIFAAMAYDTPTDEKKLNIDEGWFCELGENREAFSRLYEATHRAVYAYALSFLRNTADAEDIMQDTFLKIRSAAHLYKPQGKPLAWILTITRNLCLMKIRRGKQIDDTPLDENSEALFSGIDDAEDRLVLSAAFKVLSDDENRIILLHAVSGMKHREIARSLSLPLPTVLSKYRRGLGKLRNFLDSSESIKGE